MTTLSEITETLTNQFADAVTAVEKLHVASIDDIGALVQEASLALCEGRKAIRLKREDAAALIAESIRDEEALESEFRKALHDISVELTKLRGTKQLATRAKLKAIKGGQG